MRHLTSFLTAGLLASMLVVGSSGTAVAGHESGDGDTLAVLTAAVAEANQHVADIGADIQHQQESVNRALVEQGIGVFAIGARERSLEGLYHQVTENTHPLSEAA